MAQKREWHSKVEFIPFPEGLDADLFEDYDQENGGAFLYLHLDGGIVVHVDDKQKAQEFVKEAADHFAD